MQSIYFYTTILVAVFVCFLICWTPHHVARIRFLIITKTQSWDEQSTSTQEIIHMIAGKTNRFLKLIKFEFILQ